VQELLLLLFDRSQESHKKLDMDSAKKQPGLVHPPDPLARCEALLEELGCLEAHIRTLPVNGELPGLGTYIGTLKKEHRLAEELLKNPKYDGRVYRNTSQLASYETKWGIVKRCRGLVYMWALFFVHPTPRRFRAEAGRSALTR
jgi:hypothetical protein